MITVMKSKKSLFPLMSFKLLLLTHTHQYLHTYLCIMTETFSCINSSTFVETVLMSGLLIYAFIFSDDLTF
jgi:hypothetical protein